MRFTTSNFLALSRKMGELPTFYIETIETINNHPIYPFLTKHQLAPKIPFLQVISGGVAPLRQPYRPPRWQMDCKSIAWSSEVDVELGVLSLLQQNMDGNIPSYLPPKSDLLVILTKRAIINHVNSSKFPWNPTNSHRFPWNFQVSPINLINYFQVNLIDAH